MGLDDSHVDSDTERSDAEDACEEQGPPIRHRATVPCLRSDGADILTKCKTSQGHRHTCADISEALQRSASFQQQEPTAKIETHYRQRFLERRAGRADSTKYSTSPGSLVVAVPKRSISPAQDSPVSASISPGLAQRRGCRLRLTMRPSTGSAPQSPGLILSDELAQRYRAVETIGRGASGRVQLAVRKVDGMHVALKNTLGCDEHKLDIARKEYELLKSINHPHVPKVMEFFEVQDHNQCRGVMVMEYFKGATLDKAVRQATGGRFSQSTAQRLASALLRVLNHLHEHRILHRDIKPQNILVAPDLTEFRLIDFNVAHCLGHGRSLTPTGTNLYAAPEVVLGEPPSDAADVWAVGLCIFLSLSGRLPQGREACEHGAALTEVVLRRIELDGKRWKKVPEPCKMMLRCCLALDKRERPVPSTLLRMQWLQVARSQSPFRRWSFESVDYYGRSAKSSESPPPAPRAATKELSGSGRKSAPKCRSRVRIWFRDAMLEMQKSAAVEAEATKAVQDEVISTECSDNDACR